MFPSSHSFLRADFLHQMVRFVVFALSRWLGRERLGLQTDAATAWARSSEELESLKEHRAEEPVQEQRQPEMKTLDSIGARVSESKCLAYQNKEDWDQRFKALQNREGSADIFSVGVEFSTFLANFRHTAEEAVTTIVEEMAFEDSEKTLKPQPLDGDDFFATDDMKHFTSLLPMLLKYQCDGLLIYMCSNFSVNGSVHQTRIDEECVDAFHKLVGHQVRAARAIQIAIEEFADNTQPICQDIILQIPLQCSIDYLGFRAFVIASSSPGLTSTRQSLVSQAETNQAHQLHHQLKLVYDNLGLLTDSMPALEDVKNELHSDCSAPAYFPVSAGFSVETREAALVFKLHNLMDIFPADVSSDEPNAIANEVLLCKMRPEFVRMHGNSLPLYSNTHLSIDQQNQCAKNKSHTEQQLLQQFARSAHDCLETIIIPEFVADLENGTVQVIDSRSLTRALHEAGINMRYLSSCYELSSLKHIRRALLAEMVARAIKIEFRASLREILPKSIAAILTQAVGSLNLRIDDEPRRNTDITTARALAKLALENEASQITVECFNLVFGVSSLDSKLFWEERILPQLHAKFGRPGEKFVWDTIINEDLLHMPQLFHALQVQTGVCYSDYISYNLRGATPFSCDHMQYINSRTKLLVRSTAACERAMKNADAFLAAQNVDGALSSILFQISILETAPSDERNSSLCHLLTCAANILLEMDLPDKAEQLAVLAIEESPSNHAELACVYTVLMKLKYASNDLVGIQECFAKSVELVQWHLGPVHPLLCNTYMAMTEILGNLGKLEQALEIMQNCVVLVRDCFGKTSLLYADIRRQQGMLMFTANFTDGAAVIGVLEDAFSVYEKHFHGLVEDVAIYKEFAAECCYVLATLYIQVNGNQAAEAAYRVALTGLGLRKEVLMSSHKDMINSFLQLGNLSRDIGEHYRAVDYFKSALSTMKLIQDVTYIDQIRSITKLMLQEHIQTLSLDMRHIVDKTAKRYAQQWPHFVALTTEPLSKAVSISDTNDESALLALVMTKLFRLEPTDYIDLLIEKTNLEYQDYRKQYNFNLAGTLHRDNTGAFSSQQALLRSSSGCISSFSGTFSPPSSPRAFLSPMSHPTLFPSSPRGRMSFDQLDCNFLRNSLGEFTYGGQLAAILFLIDHSVAKFFT
ncbi:Tetratricopeptide-like helical [Plasmopara halstedii]|uniref:Tetratricopeptide-like helical n=1 Tax=Plasmopara halstedii TaxID=4781 RepID=A0A0P1AR97_PLAHL|nr:Tetratricopeptide-like helical [Plasmopara halstedii]CEG43890.1 Tetratricopeptide-like helical [Plasmopara halstedii]|eukprot:XP_024580259.1 Tetratricopeptide-like helical [Plasmopara halstedii]